MIENNIITDQIYTVENFSAMYTRYQSLVRQQINKLHIYRDHDDYFQEGMCAVVQALTSLEPYHPNKMGYITQHVRRRLIDKLRKENRMTAPIIFTDDDSQFEQGNCQDYECELLDLFDPEDHVLMHYVLKGYSTREMANKLGISIRTVQRRLQRYQSPRASEFLRQ